MKDRVPPTRHRSPNARILTGLLAALVVAVIAVVAWGLVATDDVGPSTASDGGSAVETLPETTGSVEPAPGSTKPVNAPWTTSP